MEKARVILDLCGKPVGDGHYLSTCHGYYAYVESEAPSFIKEFFKSISLWSGATKQFQTADYRYAYGYEFGCECKSFFMSMPFRVMCERHDIKLIICNDETGDETWKDVLRDFFWQYKSL